MSRVIAEGPRVRQRDPMINRQTATGVFGIVIEGSELDVGTQEREEALP